MFCEEKKLMSKKWIRTRIKRYFNDFWKVINLLSYFLFLLAEIVHVNLDDKTFTNSRRIYSLSLLVMYLRFLEVFRIHRKIGSTLVMIKEMVIYFSF